MSDTLILLREEGDYPGNYRVQPDNKTFDEFVKTAAVGLATDDPFAKAREYDVLEVQVTRRAIVKRQVEAIVNVEVLAQPVGPVEEVAA